MNGDANYDLDDVRRVYAVWGNHPALYWSQDIFSFIGRHREIRRKTVEEMRLQPGDSVLEVGCGNGRNLRYLREAVGSTGRVLGIDYTPEMLAEARQKVGRAGWTNVELRLADASSVELDEQFDAVLGVMSFSAIPNFREAMRRAAGALVPGGIFAISDGQAFSGAMSFLNPVLEHVVAPFGTWHPHRDLPQAMYEFFGNVSVRTHNGGTFFVARSRKEASSNC